MPILWYFLQKGTGTKARVDVTPLFESTDMQPRKLDIMFCFAPYGGNGATSSETPNIRQWMMSIFGKLKADGRIGELHEASISDTPITMTRNRFVRMARAKGADVIVMVDSDQNPLLHENDPGFKEFFFSSFDFLYEHYEKGPVVIGAPYCGPPGGAGSENVYVFQWQNYGDQQDSAFSLEQYTRAQASQMSGIQECAALPTGMIMYDIRAFELIEPSKLSQREVLEKLMTGEINVDQAMNELRPGFFYYEWKDQYADEKASTEDVTNTRDISLAGCAKLGYNPVFCNWDSPVGHWKPWCVSGRPKYHSPDSVAATLRQAFEDDLRSDEVIVEASSVRSNVNAEKATP